MYELFESLLNKYNVTAYKVSKDTGIAYSTFSEWKSGRSTPKQDKLLKIADYFGVSLNYLMGREETVKEENKYYLDDDTVKRLKSLKVNDKLRILFDESEKLEPSDIDFVLAMVQKLKKDGQ